MVATPGEGASSDDAGDDVRSRDPDAGGRRLGLPELRLRDPAPPSRRHGQDDADDGLHVLLRNEDAEGAAPRLSRSAAPTIDERLGRGPGRFPILRGWIRASAPICPPTRLTSRRSSGGISTGAGATARATACSTRLAGPTSTSPTESR